MFLFFFSSSFVLQLSVQYLRATLLLLCLPLDTLLADYLVLLHLHVYCFLLLSKPNIVDKSCLG